MAQIKRNFPSTYTGTIILVNVIVFLVFLVLSGIFGERTAIDNVALNPSKFLYAPWTFVTSMFMHAGLTHLFVNMVSLLFLGGFVEKLIGRKRFLWLYLGSGIFASVFFVAVELLMQTNLNVYAVGASGAIFGLGGLLAVLTPRLPVLVFFVIPMPMWLAMGFLIVFLWILSLGLGLPIGNTAHLGGLIVGLAYGFYLKRKFPRRTKMIGNYFSR
jgi:uncharacterized protein